MKKVNQIKKYIENNYEKLPAQVKNNWKINAIPINRTSEKNTNFCYSKKYQTKLFFAHNYYKLIC